MSGQPEIVVRPPSSSVRMRHTQKSLRGRPMHSLPHPLQGDEVGLHEFLKGLVRLHPSVFVCDPAGRILWASPAFDSMLGGATPGTDLYRALAKLPGSPLDGERLEGLRQSLASSERQLDLEFEWPTESEPTRGIRCDFVRSRGHKGRELLIAIVRKNPKPGGVGGHPPASGQGFSGILDISPNAILAINPFGIIVYANPAIQNLFGLEDPILVDLPVSVFARASAEFVEWLANLPGTLMEDEYEMEIKLPNGKNRFISILARPLCGPLMDPFGFAIFARDVSETVRQCRVLESKNVELENYVHTVSHDLRSPLVSLLGFSRLLRQDYNAVLDETGRHFTELIENAGRTMERLLDDLLELSRIRIHHDARTSVDPGPMLQQLKATLKLHLDEIGASLIFPENLPRVCCEQTYLYQIFSNLIGNAVQHMGECSDPRIEVSIGERPKDHLIAVRDWGRGIAPEEIHQVFDVFYSNSRTVSGTKSSGVGLSIVRKIAETYGGRAWVESTPGKGAHFYVSLPRH